MKRKFRVAITGTNGLIGRRLLQDLVQDREVEKIVAIDKARPGPKNKKIVFVRTDIVEEGSVEKIAHALKRSDCSILIHSALSTEPSPHQDELHELHISGTMHTLLAAETAGTKKLILPSTTEVYGAIPENPSFLKEEDPLKGGMHSAFFRDKIDAERQFMRFQRRFPKKMVTILRACTILGQNIVYSKTSFLTQPMVPTVLGYDPLLQFVHIKDVLRAIELAMKRNHPGVFNIVGDGLLPLSRALRITNKVNLPTSSALLCAAADLLWHLNIGPAPASHTDYLKYSFIADGSKARKIMGFEPIYSSEEALISLVSVEGAKERIHEEAKEKRDKGQRD